MNNNLRVAVVGGGVGGLSAGLALARRGIEVTVHEQAPALGDVGAGVQLTPNSIRLLDRLGLGAELRRLGVPLDSRRSTYYRMDGTPVAPIRTTDSTGENHIYGMHRADLVNILAAALPEGVVRTGHRCVGLRRDDSDGARVRLGFSDSSVVTADVVVAADGIHSTLQHHVVEPARPVDSGSVAYRGLIPAAALPSWPRDRFELWMGDGKHLLVFPVRSGALINYVGFVPGHERAEESWSAPGDTAELVAAFHGWDTRVQQLLDTVRTTFWWGLYDREPLPRWTDGRIALLGDAAHPMLPHLGQGANQSIEDAITLSVVLAGATPDTAPARLHEYEALRRPRTARVQAGARANGLRYDSRYEDLGQRDAELNTLNGFRLSLYDYDAEQAAHEALAAVGTADR